MATGKMIRVTAKSATEIANQVRLGEPAQKLLGGGLTPEQYLDRLLSYQLFGDAIRFLAHALPPREAVWWGCLCLRLACEPAHLAPAEAAALKAAVAWVVHPDEKHRRNAETAGNQATSENPAGCLATGAFYSGGSLNPPDLPAAPAKPYTTAKTVSGAVRLSATLAGPEKTQELQRQFMVLGLGVAMGKNRWDNEV